MHSRMMHRLIGGDEPDPKQIEKMGMVLCELMDGAATKAIGAAVADVSDDDAVALNENGRERRLHGSIGKVGLCSVEDVEVGAVNCAADPFVGRVWPALFETPRDRVDRGFAGHL